MKRYSLIYASNASNIIGVNNTIPWRYKEDFEYFKQYTLNSCVVMGRKTYQSIGKALPQRLNVVISSDPTFKAKDALQLNDLASALGTPAEHCCVIGGSTVYQQSIDFLIKKGKEIDVSRTIIPDQCGVNSQDIVTYFEIPQETDTWIKKDLKILTIKTSKNVDLYVVISKIIPKV